MILRASQHTWDEEAQPGQYPRCRSSADPQHSRTVSSLSSPWQHSHTTAAGKSPPRPELTPCPRRPAGWRCPTCLRLLGSVPTVLQPPAVHLHTPIPSAGALAVLGEPPHGHPAGRALSAASQSTARFGCTLLPEQSESMKTESGPCDLWFRCTLHKSLLAAHQGCSVCLCSYGS